MRPAVTPHAFYTCDLFGRPVPDRGVVLPDDYRQRVIGIRGSHNVRPLPRHFPASRGRIHATRGNPHAFYTCDLFGRPVPDRGIVLPDDYWQRVIGIRGSHMCDPYIRIFPAVEVAYMRPAVTCGCVLQLGISLAARGLTAALHRWMTAGNA